MRRDEAEREADKAREDIEKQFLDEVEGIESNATNATEPEKKNSSAPADPEACEAATKAVDQPSRSTRFNYSSKPHVSRRSTTLA